MTLQTGARVGPYEILVKLGEGGMGEVYRARSEPELAAGAQREALALTLPAPAIRGTMHAVSP